jgi:acetyl-CoA carboxylase biotin carboxylase subunit
MNTRLQVEHPVTEWVTGLDLVHWQIKVAEGEPIPFLEPIPPRGHAIEARIYAEDPARNFLPSPGKIDFIRVPGGPNVRDDGGVYPGYTVPSYYDPMISKLSVWAPTRREAIARMKRALSEYMVKGITTNIRYLLAIMDAPEFVQGDYDTGFLGRSHQALLGTPDPRLREVAVLASAVYRHQQDLARAAKIQAPRANATTTNRWRRFPGRPRP